MMEVRDRISGPPFRQSALACQLDFAFVKKLDTKVARLPGGLYDCRLTWSVSFGPTIGLPIING